MTSCLGLYIEPRLIKYAKITKDRDSIKVDSFGIKFYDKIEESIKQIISETDSQRTPISVNLSEETYRYFYMFNLLKKTDLAKAIKTEFDALCTENGINKNTIESRYALVNCTEDKEKLKIIHVSTSKIAINTINQKLSGKSISNISPIGTTIANIADITANENILIVNLEEKTTLTTITGKNVYNIETISEGSQDILREIATKENSYSKAYDICKNSTIYTMNEKEVQDDSNEYLENIMPTLYKIAVKVKDSIDASIIKIDKIYLTGTLSVINNIDLYFQEILGREKCEIMKPFFIEESLKINIKDYMEVNSALAIALQGVGYGLKDMNFQEKSWKTDVSSLLTKDIGSRKNEIKSKSNIDLKKLLHFDLGESLDSMERLLMRIATGIFIFTVIYISGTFYLGHQINEKNNEINTVKSNILENISSIGNDILKINQKANKYKELSSKLQNISEQIKENNKYKKAIPNFLTELTNSIPKDVQITEIENVNDKHIIISAQSSKYEQLGIFEAILRVQGILVPDTVKSSSAIKQGNIIQIRIEGDLV